jgi:hypothetical protein
MPCVNVLTTKDLYYIMSHDVDYSTWLSSRIPIMGFTMCGMMGSWWNIYLMVVIWFCNVFKNIYMVANNEPTMKDDSLLNYIIWLWAKFPSSSTNSSNVLKLVDVACVQILEYVEYEHCFFVLVFMKSKLKNCVAYHLDLYMCFLHNDFALLKKFLLKRPSNIRRTQRHNIALMLISKKLFFEIIV